MERQYFAVMRSNIYPIRRPPPRDYAMGWTDGALYVERVRSWAWRVQGAFAALAIAAVAIAAALFLTGGIPS